MDNCHDFLKLRLGIANDNLSNSLMMTSAQVFESSVTTTKFKFTFIWAIALLDQLLLLSSNYLTFSMSFFHWYASRSSKLSTGKKYVL